jgi:hypothetical protein
MALDGEITLTVHGLEVDNGNVRAEVFISKFSALLKTLHMADKHANARKAHDFLITGLEQGSAHATLRERVSLRKIIPVSSVDFVQEVVTAVYNGDRNIRRFPADIIESLSAFTNGIGKKFSHGEIHFSNDNAIRVDDYLEKQLNRALQRIHGELDEAERFFEGVAIETFDGIVKQIDARHGTLVRGKLVLTAGGKEIDCGWTYGLLRWFRKARTFPDGRARWSGSGTPVAWTNDRIAFQPFLGHLRVRGLLVQRKGHVQSG